jgi:hypothetical protein
VRGLLALGAALLVVAGCGGGDGDDGTTVATGGTTQPTTSTAATTTAPAEQTALRLYFVRDGKMGVATRDVPATPAVAAAAVRELLRGPDALERAGGLQTSIPGGTELRGVTIADGVATVDLSRAFESGGGSTTMLLRVAQVVHTLTQFPTVRSVAFRLDGEDVDAIGGEGVVVSPPVDRGDFEDQAPAILVESVGPGDEVSSPLRVTGTANTFEATLNLRLVTDDGQVLHDDFATATSGTGTRGTFDETIEFDGEGPATLVAYERSAEDGSEIKVVRIPVILRR